MSGKRDEGVPGRTSLSSAGGGGGGGGGDRTEHEDPVPKYPLSKAAARAKARWERKRELHVQILEGGGRRQGLHGLCGSCHFSRTDSKAANPPKKVRANPLYSGLCLLFPQLPLLLSVVQKGGAEVHDCKKAGGRCEKASACRALKYNKLLTAHPGLIDALHKERRSAKEYVLRAVRPARVLFVWC